MKPNSQQAQNAGGPLAGVRVIDLTTVAMGPYATQILGDMGADVIKVESPGGDVFRHAAPTRNAGMGAAFLNLNRNKRSIVLDLKCPADQRALLDLVKDADVFVYNVRPGSMRKLGLDYESLRKVNPRIIHCGTYGFSERGPYAGRPAFDDIIQAMSGMAALQGHNGGSGPEYVNTIIADKAAGLTAAYAIVMALYERERSGMGQAVEVPMFETIVSFLLLEHMAGETFVPAADSMGYERVLSPNRKPYRTRDGYIGLLPYTTAQWQRFFAAAGETALAADPRVGDPAARSRNIDALYAELGRIVATRTTAEWVELLKDADIPMTPVRTPDDLLTDPHLRALDFFHRETHPSEGEIRTIGIPVTFSRTPGGIRRLPPRLGEHREEILRECAADKPQEKKASSIEMETWPSLPWEAWKDTCATLHLWTQIVGKVRLVQSPWLNHSWHATLYVTSRGLATSPIAHGTGTFEIEFDFVDHRLAIRTSAGAMKTMALAPRPVAEFYEELMATLEAMDIPVKIRTMPNEIADGIPFEKDRIHASYDAAYANRFWRVLVQCDRVLKQFRAGFIGKCSPVHFFWGSFDLAVTRFSGRGAPPHPGGVPRLPDWIAREAYSREVASCGFWPGSAAVPYAAFYAYGYPAPPGLAAARVRPAGAAYNDAMGEFLLPYDVVRLAPSPDAALLDFAQSTYAAVAELGGWDREALEQEGVPM